MKSHSVSDTKRYRGIRVWMTAFGICALIAEIGLANDPSSGEPDSPFGSGFTIRVVDERGQPVEGALAGLNLLWGTEGVVFGCNEELRRTDARGELRLERGARLVDRVALVALHDDQCLVGMKLPEATRQSAEEAVYEIEVVPACRVYGQAVIPQLQHDGKSPGNFFGVAAIGELDPFQWVSRTSEFELWLPPGQYDLHVRGNYGQEVAHQLSVEPGMTELHLNPIELAPTALGLMRGKPAAELREVNAWKNSEGLRLSDLRGRYILLHFWGHWCSPCISEMPKLFEIHDRFPEKVLSIVSAHVCIAGDDEVDTSDKLDTAIANVRSQAWGGRDLPFPVAFLRRESIPRPDGQRDFRSQVAADFGVASYPTTILIDPEGRVLDIVDIEHFRERVVPSDLLPSEDGMVDVGPLLEKRILSTPVLPGVAMKGTD